MLTLRDYKRAARTILFTALLCAASLAAPAAGSSSPLPAFTKAEVKKAENVIAKLRQLEELTARSPDFESYRALVNKLSPDLFIRSAELADGDLKTDLTTAIFLYDEALQEFQGAHDLRVVCADEPRVAYARLCADPRNDSLPKLLWAKARLHTTWAVAVINYSRGANDLTTTALLAERRRESAVDLVLAQRAVATLGILEREVCNYSSLGEFEAHGKLALVSFERFSRDAAEQLPVIDRVLRSLPRSPLFYSIYHARNAYLDGLFWWRKTYRLKEMVVSANSFTEPEEMKLSNMDANVVNYTVAIHWRKAIKHTREAERIIEASRHGGG